MPELLVATGNRGKVREFEELLKQGRPSLRVRSLADFSDLTSVVEDGRTFLENAEKKARWAARQTNLLTLADDSGLEVDALGGRPGILSARYAGVGASDGENVKKLLREMKKIPEARRTARFVCALALCTPDGRTANVLGSVEGVLTETTRGTGGFGYDPLFFIPTLGQTFAELPSAEKNRLSHRADALRKIERTLDEFLKSV